MSSKKRRLRNSSVQLNGHERDSKKGEQWGSAQAGMRAKEGAKRSELSLTDDARGLEKVSGQRYFKGKSASPNPRQR